MCYHGGGEVLQYAWGSWDPDNVSFFKTDDLRTRRSHSKPAQGIRRENPGAASMSLDSHSQESFKSPRKT